MYSKETLAAIRAMSNSDRLRQTLQMMSENFPAMFHGSPELVDRRFALLRKQNDERNQRLREALARASNNE